MDIYDFAVEERNKEEEKKRRCDELKYIQEAAETIQIQYNKEFSDDAINDFVKFMNKMTKKELIQYILHLKGLK